MRTDETARSLSHLFSELSEGVKSDGFVLNTGDIGLLRSLDGLSAGDASRSANGGATIAAHVQHLRYGLSLMNDWATNGGNPFANAKWDEAWKVNAVNSAQWAEIRNGLRDEATRWVEVLKTPRDTSAVEYTGLLSSVAHLAYHFGAIRQIARSARGPTEGTFA
ncbi:MAG: hypothetical protein ACKOEC_21035 [Acidimicrobiia bacterium]